jgi:hypothetical protein
MKQQKNFLFVAALALMAGTGVLLAWFQSHQTLGRPGVTTSAITNSNRLRVELPVTVLDYKSERLDPADAELGGLPPDTSFGKRIYQAPDGFATVLSAVLMGTDRTSLHKPQFCLEGQGWHIDETQNLLTHVRIERPCAYDLPLMRLVTTNERMVNGGLVRTRGIYVYWYVADGMLDASVSGKGRMWSMARDMLLTGVMQRWAYVSCLSESPPGQEEATFERMKKFIAAAAPEFQAPPASAVAAAGSAP